MEHFTQTNVFCSDVDRFCSFDNWLCDPISENWQLMLAMSQSTTGAIQNE